MNSMEAMKQVLIERPEAGERVKEIAQLPAAEAKEALYALAKEYGVELAEEDFNHENLELCEKDLEQVSGGEGGDFFDYFGLFTGIMGLFPPSTGRGTVNGTNRFKK